MRTTIFRAKIGAFLFLLQACSSDLKPFFAPGAGGANTPIPLVAGFVTEIEMTEDIAKDFAFTDLNLPEGVTLRPITEATLGTWTETNGGFSFAPNRDANGENEISCEAARGSERVACTVRIRIAAVNDAPTIQTVAPLTVDEDSAARAISIQGLDVDGDVLTYAVANPTKGTIEGLNAANGTFSYQPKLNENGEDTVSVTVTDPAGLSASAQLRVTIGALNDAPVALDRIFATNEDVQGVFQLTATDVDSQNLTFRVVGAPTRGVASLNANGQLTYTPNTNLNGADQLTYAVSDGLLDSATQMVTLNVAAINDPPAILDRSLTLNEDEPATLQLTATDIDSVAFTFRVGANSPAKGTVSINAAGLLQYSPAANQNGPDDFSYIANDGSVDSTEKTVTVDILPVADAPTVTNLSFNVVEDAPFSARQLVATDADAEALVFALGAPQKGEISGLNAATGAFQYRPLANQTGVDTFAFSARDGSGLSASGTVSVAISAVNDPPAILDRSLPLNEDEPATLQLTATDVDSLVITFRVGANTPAKGTVAINASGLLQYSPAANQNGPDDFSYIANDGSVDSTEKTVTVDIRPVTDAPRVTNLAFNVNEDAPFSARQLVATDVDGDVLVFALAVPQKGETSGLNAATGAFQYRPLANQTGVDTFAFSARDGSGLSASGTVSVTISAVNDAPVATGSSISATQGQVYSGALSATDVDGPSLQFSVVTPPAKGTVILNSTTGTYTYTANGGALGADSFTFRAFDGALFSNTAAVSVAIAPALPKVRDQYAGDFVGYTFHHPHVFTYFEKGDLEIWNVESATYRVSTIQLQFQYNKVRANGNRLYVCGKGPNEGLLYYDVTNASQPTLVAVAGPECRDIVVEANFVYAADAQGKLTIYRASDLVQVSVIAAVAQQQTDSITLEKRGNALYLASYEGLDVFDVSNPSAPRLTLNNGIRARARHIAFLGNSNAYLSTQTGLVYLSLSNPLIPTEIKSFPITNAFLIFIHGTYLYADFSSYDISDPMNVGAPRNDFRHKIQIAFVPENMPNPYINHGKTILDPFSVPNQIAELQTPSTLIYARSIAAKGKDVYVYSQGRINVFTYEADVLKRVFNEASGRYLIARSGNALYAGEQKIVNVFDITNRRPVYQRSLSFINDVKDVTANDDVLVVATVSTLEIFDRSSLANLASYPRGQTAPFTTRLALSVDRVAILSDTVGVEMVDISRPANPRQHSLLADVSLGGAVALRDNILFTRSYTQSTNLGLQIIDFSTLGSPRKRGTYRGPTYGLVGHIVVEGNRVFIALGREGLVEVDVSNLDMPRNRYGADYAFGNGSRVEAFVRIGEDFVTIAEPGTMLLVR